MRSRLAVANPEQARWDFCSVLAHDESDNFVRRAYLGAEGCPGFAALTVEPKPEAGKGCDPFCAGAALGCYFVRS